MLDSNDHNDPEWQDNVVIARDVRFAKTSYRYAGAPLPGIVFLRD